MLKKHKNTITIIVFSLLLLVVHAPLLLSGELIPTSAVIAMQDAIGEDFLYSKAHTEDTAYYKLQLTNERAASLLVLGTSRTLQFQGFFFEDDASFYNAGLIASTLPNILAALELIEEDSLPDVVLIGLDEYFFNEQWYDETLDSAFPPEEVTGLDFYTSAATGVYEAIRADYTFYWRLCKYPLKIGTGATIYEHGYDQDGGFKYGSVYAYPQSNEIRTAAAVESVNTATGRYYTGDAVSEDALDTLREIAAFCEAHDIELVTFTPPVSQSVIDAIAQRDDMDYFYQISDAISAVAAEEGFEFYDFTYPESLNGTDDNFIDGFHGSDVLYLRMLIQMVEEGSCLGAYAELADLIEMDENAVSALQVQ